MLKYEHLYHLKNRHPSGNSMPALGRETRAIGLRFPRAPCPAEGDLRWSSGKAIGGQRGMKRTMGGTGAGPEALCRLHAQTEPQDDRRLVDPPAAFPKVQSRNRNEVV
jgi:hypothetical protein